MNEFPIQTSGELVLKMQDALRDAIATVLEKHKDDPKTELTLACGISCFINQLERHGFEDIRAIVHQLTE